MEKRGKKDVPTDEIMLETESERFYRFYVAAKTLLNFLTVS